MSKDKFLATLRLLLCIVLCMIVGALMVWFLTLTGLVEHAGTAVAFIRSFPTHLKDVAEVMTGALCMALVGGMVWELAVHWKDLLALLDCLQWWERLSGSSIWSAMIPGRFLTKKKANQKIQKKTANRLKSTFVRTLMNLQTPF